MKNLHFYFASSINTFQTRLMSGLQFDLLNSKDERKRLSDEYDAQLNFLPVSKLQLKHADETPTLTERELEIMHMTLSAWTIQAMALKLPLSVAGVKWRLSHVYFKFGVQNRLELIEKAAKKGLQFRTESGVTHTFAINISMNNHGDTAK